MRNIFSNERIKVYVNKVEQTTKGPQIYVSRSHPGLLNVYSNKKFQKFMMVLLLLNQ